MIVFQKFEKIRTSRVKVILKLDIEAHSDKPFDSTLERTVKENGTVLGIRGEGFTEE